jgi:hypothetical protein
MYGFKVISEPIMVAYHSLKDGFPQMPMVHAYLQLEEVEGKDGLVPVITFVTLVPESFPKDKAEMTVNGLKQELVHGLESPNNFMFRWNGHSDKELANLVDIGRGTTGHRWLVVPRNPVLGPKNNEVPGCLRDHGIKVK